MRRIALAAVIAYCGVFASTTYAGSWPNEIDNGCIDSWMFTSKLSNGWIHEYFGVKTDSKVRLLSYNLTARWYNRTTGGHGSYTIADVAPAIGGSLDWFQSAGHNAYTHGGHIDTYLTASVITTGVWGCDNYSDKPYDSTTV